jgi:dipeptidyl-peptidase 4
MKKTCITILFSIIFNFIFLKISIAQKKDFTMQEAVLGLGTTLAPNNLKQLQWINNNALSHCIKTDSNEYIVSIKIPENTTDTLFNLKQLNEILTINKFETAIRMPLINWINNKAFYIIINSKYYMFNSEDGRYWYASALYELPEDAENITIEPITKMAAYTKNYNIYICKIGTEPQAITTDGSLDLVYGVPVHRDEFGIVTGLYWSPDGTQLAYYKMDQSMVTNYPIINWMSNPAAVKNIKYPFAGNASHQVSLINYNVINRTYTRINTPEKSENYLTAVTWHANSRHIFIALLNREQNNLALNKYNATDGQLAKTVLTEKHEKYVEPQHPLYFIPNKPNMYLWWSQQSGYMHLYLIDDDGIKKTKQITSGKWLVNEILGYNEANSELIITGTFDSPLEKNIYAVDIIDAGLRRINRTPGWHTGICNKDCTYILDNFSNKTEARDIDVLGVVGDFEKRILTAKNTLLDYNTAKVINKILYSKDSVKLYSRLILPTNFDSTKKYPTIVYLYNGPHVQLITNKFPESMNLWYDYLTQHGYIVFVMDGRGSGNRGFNFESATWHQLGEKEMEDQLQGVAYLKNLPFINAEKLGVHGWSFGGFMTTSLMLKYPDVFKVGVCGGPVLDWTKYEIMYTERYMGNPANNKSGYANSLLLDKTKNLKGKLLMIHGAQDDVVVWQHSQAFLKNCIDNGVQIDYFDYPTHPHNVRGKDRIHLMQKITDYFDLWLK